MSNIQLHVEYELRWEGDWHVGGGYGSAIVDRLIRRRGHKGLPYVPGSQVKGVLRHECERLAALLGADVVDPHAIDADQLLRLRKYFGPLAHSPLLIDRLFGSRFEGECLFVSDAVADHAATSFRTRTSLDRATGTVRHQRLFTTELASNGELAFRGDIRAFHAANVLTQLEDDALPCEYALLIAGLNGITQLGGIKSAGLGRCRLELKQIHFHRPVSPHDATAEFALGDDWLEFVLDRRKTSSQETTA